MATRTKTITVTGVPEEMLHKLDARVRERGGDRDEYIRSLLDRDLRGPTLTELLAPFRSQVAESRAGDEELEQLFEDAREEAFRDRVAGRS